MMQRERLSACHACPDGQVWDYLGPTGKPCPVCNGHAALRWDGSALPPYSTPEEYEDIIKELDL